MGRKRKYNTKNEKREAELRWKREWYNRNARKVKQDRMRRYWESTKVDTKVS